MTIMTLEEEKAIKDACKPGWFDDFIDEIKEVVLYSSRTPIECISEYLFSIESMRKYFIEKVNRGEI